MAAGEYVSVSSQSDTEQADLAKERQALDEADIAPTLLTLAHLSGEDAFRPLADSECPLVKKN